MQTLRNSRRIARIVLAWFALFVGVSVASPMVSSPDFQAVCSASGGMKFIVVDDDGSPDVKVAMGMDCPLCASLGAPPPALSVFHPKPSPLAHALRPIVAAHIASATAPPLPSRGPPLLSA